MSSLSQHPYDYDESVLQTDFENEKSTRELDILLTLQFASRHGVFEGVGTIVVGVNIFSSSLLNRGWKFWKPPILTGTEKLEISSVHDRLIASAQQLAELAQEMTLADNYKSKCEIMVGGLKLVDESFSKYSTELKRLLNASDS